MLKQTTAWAWSLRNSTTRGSPRSICKRPWLRVREYPEALNNLGVLYLRTHRAEEAEKSFRESIRVAPSFDQSYLNLARLYTIEGDSSKSARGAS